jgi:hypothetical protein
MLLAWIGRITAMMPGLIDVVGYAASGLTLATFAQRAMLPMRMLAIGANFCFIGYGALGSYMPVLILHLILLPINLVRLRTLLAPSGDRAEARRDDAANSSPIAGLSSGLL